jgi:hypothetical protein
VPTARFAREPLPKLALFANPSPPGYTTLRAEVQRVPYNSHKLARQSSPELLYSQCITSCRADVGGPIESTRIWRSRSWRHPRIQSSARTRPVRPSRWVCARSSRRRTRCTETGIPAPSSTFAIACAVRGGVQANLLTILARPFMG